jgi:hypothetical protein
MQVEKRDWNRYYIPIEKKDKENEDSYLQRVHNGLVAFFNKYTRLPERCRKEIIGYWGNPKNLEEENNFCEMNLEGIVFCDVKFFVYSRESPSLKPGIDICCHRDDQKRREPMINFVVQKWKEFDYQF